MGVAYSTSPLTPFDGVHTRWLQRCDWANALFSSRRAAFCALGLAGGLLRCSRLRQPRRPPPRPRLLRSLRRGSMGRPRGRNSSKRHFAANPVSGGLRGPARVRWQIARPHGAGLAADVGRLETARARTLAFDAGRPHAGAAARAGLSAGRARGRPLLEERSRMAVPQPCVLPGLPRSRDLPQQALCAARAAHAGLHRLCA